MKRYIKSSIISYDTYRDWYDQPILHDEDMWDGRYKTYGEMWSGEGYMYQKRTGINKSELYNCE